MMDGSTLATLDESALVIIFRSHDATVIGLQFFISLGSFPALGITVMQDCLCEGANAPVSRP